MGKRLFDIAVGTALAVAMVPLVLILAVGSALALGCWPFFVQERVGRFGRPFRLVKLRTLPYGSEPYLLKSDLEEAQGGAFPAFLRRHHLDELPELFLVPLGRLSLVGPRPKMPDAVEPVDPVYHACRVQVRQGCSGLWQIGRHSHELPHQSPEYDFYYLRHACLRLDLWVLWRTALMMLGLAGPVAVSDVPTWTLSRRSRTLRPRRQRAVSAR